MPYKTILSFSLFLLATLSSQAQAEPTGNKKTIIAIIDTGTNLTNSSIQPKLWINPGEIPGNGIDDDHNGFVDDVYGWNFVDGTNKVQDLDGHGSHITSIIAPGADERSLMILKYYQEKMDPQKNLANCLKAFKYAIDNGAKVINFSGGGYGESPEEKSLLRRAADLGILVVAAAGNDHINNDMNPYFPASYKLTNIIAVGSLSNNGTVSKFSNFGEGSVHIFADGEEVQGIDFNGEAIRMSGTSQATALVSRDIAEFARKNAEELTDIQEFIGKMIVTRKISKQINIAQLTNLKSNSQTALGVQVTNSSSEQWIFNTH